MVGCSTGASLKNQEVAECQIWIVDQENKLSFTNSTLAACQNQFLFPPSLLPVQWVGGCVWHPGAGPRSLVIQTGLNGALEQCLQLLFLPKVFSSSHLPLPECGLPPAEGLGVPALDPVVTLSLPFQLLQTWEERRGCEGRTQSIVGTDHLKRQKTDLNWGNVIEKMLKLLLGSFSGEKCWTLLESSWMNKIMSWWTAWSLQDSYQLCLCSPLRSVRCFQI